MKPKITRLLDDAETDMLQEAANPVVEQLKCELVAERKEKLSSLIEEEKKKLQTNPLSLEESARDLAALSVQLDRQNSIFGYRRGSNYYVAARLYAQGRRPKEIEHETGIPVRELTKLINHKTAGWKLQRDRIFETIAQELKKENLPVLKKLTQMGYTLIEKAFEERIRQIDDAENPKPVQLAEGMQVATIMAFVAKERRLDEESDIHAKEKSLTPTEIFKQFADDPYFGPAFKKMVKDVVPIEVGVNGTQSRDSSDT